MNETEEIKQRLDIAELIGRYVPLKPAGRNLKGVCPFHSEKTPSFMVSPEKGIWHCFGCHEGGDVFSFYQRIEGVEFPEALEELAKRAGVTLEKRQSNTKSVQLEDKLLLAHKYATDFFEKSLESSSGKKAQDYLADRKVNEGSIKRFGLGFSPDSSWDPLTLFLKTKGFSESELIESGLSLKGNRGLYDRFRGRLIFPISDHRDRVVGFAGRVLPGDDRAAKYLNSPESPIYHKGDVLYGFTQARDAIRDAGEAILVEGNLDVILSSQAGAANVVAASGTALTAMQLKRLSRIAGTIKLAFDPDTAGEKALERVALLPRSTNLNLYVIPLPPGLDPADVATRDAEDWHKRAKDAVYLYDFLLEQVLGRYNLSFAPDKRRAAAELTPYLSGISDRVEQTHYLKLLAERLGVREEDIRKAASGKPARTEDINTYIDQAIEVTRQDPLEAYIIGLLLNNSMESGFIFRNLEPDALRDRDLRLLYTELTEQYNSSAPTHAGLFRLKELTPELRKMADLLSLSEDYQETDEAVADPKQEIKNTVNRLRERYLKVLQLKLSEASDQAKKAGDHKREAELKSKYQRVVQALSDKSLKS
jgi:DNA primase